MEPHEVTPPPHWHVTWPMEPIFQSHRESRQKERDPPPACSLCRWSHRPRLSQAESRSPELHPALMWVQGTKCLGHLLLLSQMQCQGAGPGVGCQHHRQRLHGGSVTPDTGTFASTGSNRVGMGEANCFRELEAKASEQNNVAAFARTQLASA